MKHSKIIIGAGALVAAGLAIFALNAAAKEKAHFWELKVTTAAGEELNTVNNWTCIADAEWSKPPASLTGAQCPAQTFTRNGDVLTWTAGCDGVEGQGEWTFSKGDRSIEGQSTVTANGVTSVIALSAKQSGTCDL